MKWLFRLGRQFKNKVRVRHDSDLGWSKVSVLYSLLRIKRPLVLGLVIMPAMLLAADQPAAQASSQPNIIFFLADDQRSDVLGAYGNQVVQSPTLDRLAAEGVRFTNAFCQVPICAASRATLLSGLSQRTHGYNFGKPPVPAEYIASSYPQVLKDAGYRIGFAGKYGMKFAGSGLKPNFDFFKSIGRSPFLKQQQDGTKRHETDLCADAAIAFIESNPDGQPFCMSISFNATQAEDKDRRPGYHFQWPESADGLYENIEMPIPKLGDAKYFEALPEFMQSKEDLSRQRFFWRWDTPEKYQTNMRAYYRMITGIDHAIARVIQALEAKGVASDTIIVYSADNGFMMGDRGIAGKWNHYEQSLNVPLIVYDPRLPVEQRGQVYPQIVSNVDMAPTFVDFAGVDVPAVYQGKSLVPLIYGASEEWRDDAFFEHTFRSYNDWNGVRSEDFKYARYYNEPAEVLYDLKNDPHELTNLASNPEYAPVLKKMQQRLAEYLAQYPQATRRAKNKK